VAYGWEEDEMALGLTRETWRVIGHVRDVTVILVIAVGGMYVLSNPAKFDAFLNWMRGRQ
jgi:hypothetical protein